MGFGKMQEIPKPGNPDDNPDEFEEEEEPAAWLARLGLDWRLRVVNLFCKGEVSPSKLIYKYVQNHVKRFL